MNFKKESSYYLYWMFDEVIVMLNYVFQAFMIE